MIIDPYRFGGGGSRTASPGAGAITLAGVTPGAGVTRPIAVPVGAITVTGRAPIFPQQGRMASSSGGATMTISADGRTGTIGTETGNWSAFHFGSAVTGSGHNYMEWVGVSGGPNMVFGMLDHAAVLGGTINPNGTALYGAQNNQGFQGPSSWIGGYTGSSVGTWTNGDVMGCEVTWSTLELKISKNGVVILTTTLPNTGYDPYYTQNTSSIGTRPSVVTTHLTHTEWVYAPAGVTPFPQCVALLSAIALPGAGAITITGRAPTRLP